MKTKNTKFDWKNKTKSSMLSKNVFFGKEPGVEKGKFPRISSIGNLDFVQLTPETPKIPRFYQGGSFNVTQPTLFMAGDSRNVNIGQPERVTVDKNPNQMVASTNKLTISQEKFKERGTMGAPCPPTPGTMSANPGGGGRDTGGGGGAVRVKNMTTFEKVAMETAFLPIWRSFNA
jgi:hypothetical protein